MKTTVLTASKIKRQWHLVDAKGRVLGRLASEIAQKLIGKHKKEFTPNLDAGDYIVVINAAQVELTRGKENKKVYYHHTGFVGHLKETAYADLLAKHPEKVIEKAVYNMLPKNKLRSVRMNRLKVYAGVEHPHISHFSKQK